MHIYVVCYELIEQHWTDSKLIFPSQQVEVPVEICHASPNYDISNSHFSEGMKIHINAYISLLVKPRILEL